MVNGTAASSASISPLVTEDTAKSSRTARDRRIRKPASFCCASAPPAGIPSSPMPALPACWLAGFLQLVVTAQWPPPSAQRGGGVEACSSTAKALVPRVRLPCNPFTLRQWPPWLACSHWWTLVLRVPPWASRCSLVDRPFSVRELQFCGRKGGMGTAATGTPRALHCDAQHSTAYRRTRMEPLVWSVTAYMHTNFGAVVDLLRLGPFVLADRDGDRREAQRQGEERRLARRMEPSCSVHVSLKLLASPDAASVIAICN